MTMMIQPSVPISVIDVPIASPNGRVTQFGADGAPRAQSWDRSAGRTYTADSNTSNDRSNNGINRSNRNVLLYNNSKSNGNAEDVKVTVHHQQPQFKQLPYSHHHHHHNSIISSSPATTPTCLSETTPRNDSSNKHQQQYHHKSNHHNNNNNININMMHAVTPTSYNNNNGNGMMMMMNARPGNNNNTPQPNRLYINTTFGMQHNHNDIPQRSNDDNNTIISSLQCGSIQLNPYWNASYEVETTKPIPTFIIVPIIKNKMENNTTEQINSTIISKSLSTAEETIDTTSSTTSSSSSALDDDIAMPTFKKKNRSSFRKMLSFKRMKNDTKCKKQTNGMIV